MKLPAGSMLCEGVASKVNPARPMHLCVACERRLSALYMHEVLRRMKPQAVHDGRAWACNKRIEAQR